VAVISLDGIVNWKVSRVAGFSLDRDIITFAREEFNLVLGEMVAEDIKKKIGSALPLKEPLAMPMRGRDVITGLPKEYNVNSLQVQEAIGKSVHKILDVIKLTLETTPPELAADIYQKGIILTGGTAMLKNLDEYIARDIQIPVHVADDPQTCAVRGMGYLLDNFALLKDVVIPSSQ
jgi:rod shape-determining protein MreB